MHKTDIISDAGEMAEWCAAISAGDWLALDTEFLRERTYVPQLCLIQLATGAPSGQISTCIDVLAIDDLSPLSALLANPHVTKIFHSCRQDFEALDTRFPLQINNLYDTQIADAFCSYGEQASYAKLVESFCAVHLPKAYTRADWSRRPLPPAQLEYALDDVKYLQPLREHLDQLLTQKGRLEWHADECAQATAPDNYRFAVEDAWQRLRGTSRLTAVSQLCAKKLAIWREQIARTHNRPRGWILPTPMLLKICQERPSTLDKLAGIEEIGARFVKRRGQEIIALVAQSEDEAGTLNITPIPMLTVQQRNTVKKIMQLIEQRAKEAEISRALLANRQEIENFVQAGSNLPLFSGWRAQLVGDEIREHYAATQDNLPQLETESLGCR